MTKKFRKKDIVSLLLCYEQSLLFSSIEDVLVFVTQKAKVKSNNEIYKKGSIDDINRKIIETNYEASLKIQKTLDQYGIKTTIDEKIISFLNDDRENYIKYKFKSNNWKTIDDAWKKMYEEGKKIPTNGEPIILNIPDQDENEYRGIIFISYHQSKKWDDILLIIDDINEKYLNEKEEKLSSVNNINKYNRVFLKSNDLQLIEAIENEFKINGICTIRLKREDEFIPYRYEYIQKYYGENFVSYINQKWKLEFLNGWFNKENWDPIILKK